MSTPTPLLERRSCPQEPQLWYTRVVKTTIELPDTLFPSAKAHAAHEGLSLRIFFERAVESELRRKRERVATPGWKRSFGKLRDMRAATREVQRVVDREFSRIDVDTWK